MPVVRRWDIAGRLPEEALEADDARLGHAGQLADVVLGYQTVETNIAIRLRFGQLAFVAHALRGAGWRQGVGHVEHGGHTAHDRRASAGPEVFFIFEAWFPEVDVRVNDAG